MASRRRRIPRTDAPCVAAGTESRKLAVPSADSWCGGGRWPVWRPAWQPRRCTMGVLSVWGHDVGRYTGHCRGCNQNFVATDSECCPQCGEELTVAPDQPTVDLGCDAGRACRRCLPSDDAGRRLRGLGPATGGHAVVVLPHRAVSRTRWHGLGLSGPARHAPAALRGQGAQPGTGSPAARVGQDVPVRSPCGRVAGASRMW